MEKGVHNLPGLPNRTGSDQEMDKGFDEFKPTADSGTIYIVIMKMTKRVETQKKMKLKLAEEAEKRQF